MKSGTLKAPDFLFDKTLNLISFGLDYYY